MADLIGAYEVKRLSLHRQTAIDAFDAAPSGHRMMGLLELDVTEARARIEAMQRQGRRVSLFAFVVTAIARALSEHRSLNAIRCGRRILEFEDVDVNIPVELPAAEGPIPHQLVVRRAAHKDAEQIYGELEAARQRHAVSEPIGRESTWNRTLMRWLGWVPRFVRLWVMRRLMSAPLSVKRWAGTAFVTSVGKFASVPGFVIPFAAGPIATSFALGSVVDKPVLRGQDLRNRAFLAVTVAVSHDIVDGGAAGRFVRRLQELVESADGLPGA